MIDWSNLGEDHMHSFINCNYCHFLSIHVKHLNEPTQEIILANIVEENGMNRNVWKVPKIDFRRGQFKIPLN